MKSLSVRLGVMIFIVGFAILGLTESCKAEGAWVLWKQVFYKTPGPLWELDSAYPDYRQCQEAANWFRNVAPGSEVYEKIIGNPASPEIIWTDPNGKKYVKMEINGKEYIVLGSDEVLFHSKDGWVVIRFKCFPDTIDPRK